MIRNPAGRRLWRTDAGGLVVDGDPAAVELAYGPDDEVAEADLPLAADIEPEPEPEPKVEEPEPAVDAPEAEADEQVVEQPKKRAGRHTPKPEE